jgi:TonB-dependent starch-binding outer membrane protein SusC
MKLTAIVGSNCYCLQWNSTLTKMLRVMKLIAFLILVACIHVSASGVAQERVTISERDVSLEKVFSIITKQTGYSFFFSDKQMERAKKVNINLKDATVKEALMESLKDQPLDFNIEGKTIFIINKESKKNILDTQIDVKGRVVNETNDPVEGVNVAIKGTSLGTSTDKNGEFSIKGVNEDATLVFTSITMEALEINVKSRSFIEVSLRTKVTEMQEVVINKGYYTEKQRFSVSNVGKITSEEIEKQPINNTLLALQGRIPGIEIVQQNGLPGAGINIRIQGQNSITSRLEPLIIVDGVPFPSQNLASFIGDVLGTSGPGANGGSLGNPLVNLNPADIESIEVLKDADATSIYGSRAANGAILITTKRAKAGPVRVDVRLQRGWGKVGNFMDLLNTPQYLEMRREALKNDGLVASSKTSASGTSIYAPDLTIWDTTRNTDWQKTLIGGTASFDQYNLSISGGNSLVQYQFGGNYQKETTVLPGNYSNQTAGIHFNVNTATGNQRFKMNFTGSYLSSNNNLPGDASSITGNILLNPVAPNIYNDDGSLNWAPHPLTGNSTWTNPIAQLRGSVFETKSNSLVGNALFSYRILTGLHVNASLGYTSVNSNQFAGQYLTALRPERRETATRSAMFANNNTKSWILEPNINYKRALGRGDLDVIVGFTIQKQDNNGQSLLAMGQQSDQSMKNLGAAASLIPITADIAEYKYNAAFARLNYIWREKWILNITGRRDGSSRFGDENKFQNFGSVGAAWIFTEEKFMKKVLPFLSFGKIRGSYGTTGSDAIANYAYLSLYNAAPDAVPYQGVIGVAVGNLSNPYLQWEDTKKLSFGIDLGFLNDRINISPTYFRNRSSNQLLNYNLPSTTGFSSIANINFPALIQNEGWEITLNTINIQSKKFRWTSALNYYSYRNKLIEFPGLENSSYGSQLVIGQPLGLTKQYRFYGINPSTGLPLLKDKDGNPTSSPTPDDRTRYWSQNGFANFTGGVLNTISFHGIQLDFLFQFAKQIGFNYYQGSNPGFSTGTGGNQPVTVLDRWQKPGDQSRFMRYGATSKFLSYSRGDRDLEDLYYIKLKNVALSYSLPATVLSKMKIKVIRLFLNAQNVFTITNFKGLDAETRAISGVPPLRMITIGTTLGF